MSAMTMFEATLRCPQCGRDGLVFVESRLGDAGRTYSVGDSVTLDIRPHSFVETSFVVRKPEPDEPIHYLSYWVCEACGAASFAVLVFQNDRVQAVDLVDLTPALLDELHFISQDVEDMLRPIVDGSVYTDTGLRSDWLEALRAGLEAGRRWPSPAQE